MLPEEQLKKKVETFARSRSASLSSACEHRKAFNARQRCLVGWLFVGSAASLPRSVTALRTRA